MKIRTFFKLCGLELKYHFLENYCWNQLNNYIILVGFDYQLVPLCIRWHSFSEWVVQPFNNHFVAGLASVHKNFWINFLWHILPHCFLTINLLRSSCLSPKLLAQSYLHGTFGFNDTPHCYAQNKNICSWQAVNRSSWGIWVIKVWCLVPKPHHYLYHKLYDNQNSFNFVFNTVAFPCTAANFPNFQHLKILP